MDEKMNKPESIRHWYERTTRKAKRAFVWATAFSLLVMMAMWIVAPMTTLSKLQTFNGALTVPLIGGLWIFAFIFMFLIPSREASFRAQEALEDGVGTIKKMIEENVIPAAQTLQRVLLLIEKEYPEIRKRVEESLAELKETSKKVEKALEDNATFVAETRPVLQALKRIEEKIEGDLLEDLKDAAEAVKRMGGMPAASPKPASGGGPTPVVPGLVIPPDRAPDLNVALTAIQKKKKEREAAEAQPK